MKKERDYAREIDRRLAKAELAIKVSLVAHALIVILLLGYLVWTLI